MPLEAAAIEAGAEGVKTVVGLITALTQFGKARRMERDNTRPTETIPQGVLDATSYAKLLSSMGMPAAEYSKALQGIDRAGTKAVSEARDRRAGIDTITTSQQATDDAMLGLSAEDARMRVGNMQNLIGQLNTLGGWQDKIWDWNFKSKYEENAAAIRSLKTAANANLGGAMNTALSGGALAATQAGGKDKTVVPGSLGFNDPTITDPDLFDNGIPSEYMNYLRSIIKQGGT